MFYIDLDRDYNTRYDMAKFLSFDDDCHSVLDSYFLMALKELSPSGAYVTLAHEEYNPALVSWNIYGSTQYWWLLMYYNDIIDIEEVVAGLTLKYPSIDALEDLYFQLNSVASGQL